MTGNEIVARTLRLLGVDTVFFLMGGPTIDCANACEAGGIRMLDVRHEQAAAMMATAYSRLRRRPSVCMAASGPGVANLVTGVANAWADGAPVVVLGGAAPVTQRNRLVFQELDQVVLFAPITRWADRCYETRRLPEYLATAFRCASSFHPGPVYLDLPGDVLYRDVDEGEVQWVEPPGERPRPHADDTAVERAVAVLEAAERPVLIYGSGVHWADADDALRALVDLAGLPFYATPQARGAVPEDHPLSFLAARGTAFRDCDAIVQVATRQSYVVDHLGGSRWSAHAKLVQIDLDPEEIGRNRRPEVALAGDARAVLEQLAAAAAGRLRPERYAGWVAALARVNGERLRAAEERLSSAARPIHPLRLCKEVRDFLPPDAVLVVDGQEILNYARQSIPFRRPRSLTSGPFGTMGVGVPFGLGAKVALPDAPVVVLHGDGSFGLNAMEIDTALRHDLPFVCVVSNNGGWTARDRHKAGRELGTTRYDLMFAPLGAHTEHVEDPERIRGALEDALAAGRPALVNVVTDPDARAGGVAFTNYAT